jgi:hypothetical protein
LHIHRAIFYSTNSHGVVASFSSLKRSSCPIAVPQLFSMVIGCDAAMSPSCNPTCQAMTAAMKYSQLPGVNKAFTSTKSRVAGMMDPITLLKSSCGLTARFSPSSILITAGRLAPASSFLMVLIAAGFLSASRLSAANVLAVVLAVVVRQKVHQPTPRQRQPPWLLAIETADADDIEDGLPIDPF